MKYNLKQKSAVNHMDGPMMVLAGPGCGKTAVISGRIQNLIRNGADPNKILVVTFTRAAAAEMKDRFHREFKNPDANVIFGTFHSVFFSILKTEFRLTSDCIVGEDFKAGLLREIINSRAEPFWENELIGGVSREISNIKGNGISSKNFYSNILPSDTFRDVYNEYRKWLLENRRLDFDDIITAAYQLLYEKPEVLKKWRQRFLYILVDEFQDISPVQYLVIKMLAAPKNNLFIVGDDDQSIYRFRGSEPAIMLRFPKDYKNCEIASLSLNYRSTPQIIKVSAEIIKANKNRYPKEIHTKNKSGGPVNLHIFKDIWEEGDELSKMVRGAISKGTRPENIAVLVRTNMLARWTIEKFIADKIPFYSNAQIPSVFDHFIAKDMIAYLNAASGSNKREDFLRIINKPNRYITKNALFQNRINLESLYMYYEDTDWMIRRIEKFENDLHAIKELPPYGAISYVRKIIGYDEYICDYAAENGVPKETLLETADEIAESARSFASLKEWERHILEYSSRVKQNPDKTKMRNSVVISTLHGSKGKEYDIVFIIDVNNGIIPYHRANLNADIEEERRLFYVGMTRARYSLNIFAVKSRFGKQTEISPFLKEIVKG